MAGFLDLLGAGAGRVGRATDLTSGMAQDPLDELLQRVLAPVALTRGVLQAADYAAKTGAGVITPSELSGQPDDPLTFLRAAQARGLPTAAEEAQHRFEAAPQAFTGQKGIVEFGLNPLNVVGAGLPAAALKVGGAGLRATPGIGRALEAAAAADAAYGQLVGGAIGTGLGGVGEGLAGLPVVGRPLQASAQAGVSKAHDVLANLQEGLRVTAKQLGYDLGEGGVTRAVFDPELRAAKAAQAASTAEREAASTAAAAGKGPAPGAAAAGAAPDVTAARAALEPAAEVAGADLARISDARLKQALNHAQQDMRESDGLATALGQPVPAAGADRPLEPLLQAAQAAAPGQSAQDLLEVAAARAQAGLERTRGTRGTPQAREVVGTVHELETTDDVAKALRLEGAAPEAINLAQAQFLVDRYGPTLPGTPGGGHELNAVAQRLAREGSPGPGAPVPPGEGLPSPAPPAAGAPEGGPVSDLATPLVTQLQNAVDTRQAGLDAMGRAQVTRLENAVTTRQAGLDAIERSDARAWAGPTPSPLEAPPTGAAGEAALGTPSVPLTGAPAVPPAVPPAVAPTYTGTDAALAAAARGRAAAGQVTAEDEAAMSTELIRRRFGVGDAQAARIQKGLEPPPGGFAPSADILSPPAPPAGTAPPPAAPPLMEGAPAPGAADAALLAREQYLQEAMRALPETAPGVPDPARDAAMAELAAIRQQRMAPPTAPGEIPPGTVPEFSGVPPSELSGAPSIMPEGPLGGVADIPPAPLQPGLQGTEVPPAVAQELTDALKARQIALKESTDPVERMAANTRVTVAQTAYDDALKAAGGLPTSTAQPDYIGAATAKSAGQVPEALLALTPGGGAGVELRKVMPGIIDQLDKDRKAAQEAAQALGLGDLSLPDAAKAAADMKVAGIAPAEAAVLQRVNNRYGKLDIFAPNTDDAALLAGYVRDVAAKRGLGDVSALGKTYQEVLTAWRQQALFAPAYHVNNILDALLKNAMYLGGSNQFTDLGPNVANAFRRTFTDKATGYGPTTAAWLEQRGISLPQEILQGGLSTEITGGVGRQAAGLERLPGVGKLFVLNREIGHAIETSARTAAFMSGYDALLAKAAPELAALAKLPLDQAKAALEARGLGQQGLLELGQLRNEAYDAGIALSDKLHFNYRDTSNLDDAMRQFVGFHMFATRNIPLYGEILATHPGMLNAMRQYDQYSTAQQKAAGLEKSKRFEGTVPLGSVGQTIANTLFGTDGQVFFNPLRYLSITGQLFGSPPNPSKGESGFGEFLDAASQWGIGPNPLVQAGLQISGAMGARQPSALLRIEPLVKAALEVANPAGGVPQTPWDTLQRQRLMGPAPADPNGAVLRRLSEMALERTGNPNDPAFVAAARQGAANPLWQQAVYDLGVQGLIERPSSLLGAPIVTQRAGAGAIAAAQAGFPDITASGGNRPLDPIVRLENAPPGAPTVTYRMRDTEMARRAAAGQPAALGYRDFAAPPGAERAQSATAQRRAAVLAEYTTASPARKAAIMADPVDGRYVWEHLLQQSPLMHQGGRAR